MSHLTNSLETVRPCFRWIIPFSPILHPIHNVTSFMPAPKGHHDHSGQRNRFTQHPHLDQSFLLNTPYNSSPNLWVDVMIPRRRSLLLVSFVALLLFLSGSFGIRHNSTITGVVDAFGIDQSTSLPPSSPDSSHNDNIGIMNALPLDVRRPLPERVLIGYATHCTDKVARAVKEGVNVVIWAFVEIRPAASSGGDDDQQQPPHDNDDIGTSLATNVAKCISYFDLDGAKRMIANLDSEGYSDTIHLISFGGWNGPHLPEELTAEEIYKAWKEEFGSHFHGIDWDLEGHDTVDYPTNIFTIDCLEKMGQFSRLAKKDGYIVGMAPAQSYLDVQSSMFSRSVNLTDPSREWHNEFHYFGANVYAYVLSKYGDEIDFVSVQFYESFSRAGMSLNYYHMSQEAYLQFYVQDLVIAKGETFFVDFDQDPTLQYGSRKVSFPISKLVLGFANGWAADPANEKACFFEPERIGVAYHTLKASNMAPRGFMYWVM
jgi:chitinase